MKLLLIFDPFQLGFETTTKLKYMLFHGLSISALDFQEKCHTFSKSQKKELGRQ